MHVVLWSNILIKPRKIPLKSFQFIFHVSPIASTLYSLDSESGLIIQEEMQISISAPLQQA
jgi:hypothetical protein